jgi:hypothetical protein
MRSPARLLILLVVVFGFSATPATGNGPSSSTLVVRNVRLDGGKVLVDGSIAPSPVGHYEFINPSDAPVESHERET